MIIKKIYIALAAISIAGAIAYIICGNIGTALYLFSLSLLYLGLWLQEKTIVNYAESRERYVKEYENMCTYNEELLQSLDEVINQWGNTKEQLRQAKAALELAADENDELKKEIEQLRIVKSNGN